MAKTRAPMLASTTPSGEKKKNPLFETINMISAVRPLTYQDLVEQNLPYDAFMVNRAFSLSEDAVKAAATMNQRPHLEPADQLAFYVHTLRPRRRFEKWPKSLTDPDHEIIAKYYGMSIREAKLSANLHTKEQVRAMRKVIEEGATPSRFR